MTYMVHETKWDKVSHKSVTTPHTLRDWCEANGPSYNTVLARIWRSYPEQTTGVVIFDSKDPILSKELKKSGKPRAGESSPSEQHTVKPVEKMKPKAAASIRRRNKLHSKRRYTKDDVKRAK